MCNTPATAARKDQKELLSVYDALGETGIEGELDGHKDSERF